jgi:pimeloyl-ACP methyl ester carboxylesterase
MAGFETTPEFEDRILAPLRNREFPAQVIWSQQDSELSAETFGVAAQRALGLQTDIHLVDGEHFLQENSPTEIADRVALLVNTGSDI